jgi:hypothetical protein
MDFSTGCDMTMPWRVDMGMGEECVAACPMNMHELPWEMRCEWNDYCDVQFNEEELIY